MHFRKGKDTSQERENDSMDWETQVAFSFSRSFGESRLPEVKESVLWGKLKAKIRKYGVWHLEMLAGLKKKILNIWETHMIKKETPEKEA